jgi:hypothetical protein
VSVFDFCLGVRYGFPAINLKPLSYPGHGFPYFSHLAHPGSLSSHYRMVSIYAAQFWDVYFIL